MKYFHKMFYNIKGIEERKEISTNRYNYESTIKTGLEIKPINQDDIFELFYVPTNLTMNLISKLTKNDNILEESYLILPEVAKQRFLADIIISEELYSTNELEGVKSTREEIVETTRTIMSEKNKKSNLRFGSVINSYLKLIMGDLKRPEKVKDYRKIYDEITSGAVSKNDLPDGELFRKDITYVRKGLKEIHRGLTSGEKTEELIIEKIKELIAFMDIDNEKCHHLIKIAIAHYYFGYLHPYYDGNGRTSRFISSIYLEEEYSLLTAMSLSRGCNMGRKKYLEAFDITNKIVSRGEMNFFVDTFLGLIIEGQEMLLLDLNEKIELLDMAFEKINNDERLVDNDEINMVFILAQELYFTNDKQKGLSIKDFEVNVGYTAATIRKKLKTVEEKGIIKKIKDKPIRYIISSDYLESKI
ncbi:Fic family protein [Tissierella creatinophila]|uniref:Adenosine monophosphate-protein transferase SoFic n=1 Tax=Tissierella creatinophila DSM 6911 TaxID=1123403 RepID=A0A1U7M7E1_TISCR|nr:Fic family protein [Tissierella creatinophila]OLS03217.1 adenosine monophosphate-protein transferase SoFic [Tissierella creatinophila DSM 6911]